MGSLTRVLSSALLALTFSPSVWAGEPADGPDAPLGTPDQDPESVYGGEPSAVCGWPSTIGLQGSCTGTLVHPQVIIYAQHCGTGYDTIQFGENISQPAKDVQTEFCKTFPGGGPGTGQDFAFCKLKEPVLDVPIVPILMGCEVDLLVPGAEVTVVGFGNADDQLPYGIKREVVTTINEITPDQEIFIGGNGKDSCNGDSGGPVFIKMADGTWRVFGITSYGGACGTGGYYSMMHKGMDWFEAESGLDLTPCTDAAGNWAPTGECKNFPMNPGLAGGDWQNGCAKDPAGGASMTCGMPTEPDVTPPTAVITMPTDGQEFMAPDGADVTIVVDAQDVGWGIKEVRLTINGQEIPGGVDNSPPYEFAATFPTGQYQIGATAIDNNANMAAALPVNIGVNTPVMMPEPETTGEESGDTSAGTGEGGSEGEGGTDEAPTEGSASSASDPTTATSPTSPTGATGLTGDDDGGDEGCSCRSGQEPKASLLALAMLGLLVRRRRR